MKMKTISLYLFSCLLPVFCLEAKLSFVETLGERAAYELKNRSYIPLTEEESKAIEDAQTLEEILPPLKRFTKRANLLIKDEGYNIQNANMTKNFNFEHGLEKVCGIGIVIEGDHQRVENLVPNSPAIESGVEVGDKLLKVNGVLASNFPNLDSLVDQIRGKENSKVKLVFQKRNKTIHEYSITRQCFHLVEFEQDYQAKTKTLTLKLGQSFSERLTEEIEASLKKYPVETLVFDLRKNNGGNLIAIRSTVSLFAPRGHLIEVTEDRIKGKLIKNEVRSLSEGAYFQKVALKVKIGKVNHSGAQILAHALHSLGAEVKIFVPRYDKTFVKGLLDLEEGYSLLYVNGKVLLDNNR